MTKKKRNKLDSKVADGDMTSMIDMVFQLIAFFTVLINFAQDEQNDRVTLPESELARPAEVPLEFPITIHLMSDGNVELGGVPTTVEGIGALLNIELQLLKNKEKSAADANIIIRAHRDMSGGRVQDLIKKCQDMGFEKFALRVKEATG
jgi:biopolymer transport protein ExbD